MVIFRGLFGVKIFRFGVIVLSKANGLLVWFVWVYKLMRELLGVLGCHFGVATGEDFVIDEEVLIESLVNIDTEDFTELLLLGML